MQELYQRLGVRVPGRLAEAIDQRAEAAGVTRSDVIRGALVRECSAPIDRRSRAFVEAWLVGDAEIDAAPAAQGSEK